MTSSDTAVLSGLRVLVVDDDADTCDLYAYVLTAAGAEVVGVASAGRALDAFNRERFDVLLSDAGLPDAGGWSLIETIRRMTPQHGGRIPAIAITSLAFPSDQAHSIAAGFDAHLSNPVEMRLVIETIAGLVGRTAASARS